MSYSENLKIAVIGAGGAIGGGFVRNFAEKNEVEKIFAFSGKDNNFESDKVESINIDIHNEDSIQQAAQKASAEGELDIVIVALGMLHDEGLMPEKSIKNMSKENFDRIFAVNTIAPALCMKHFLPKLKKKGKSAFLVLSARVGSIGDNSLGGWYAYRASKSALNMLIKNAAIEMNRRFKDMVVSGLHPGTVDSHLSSMFKAHVKPDHLFTPDYSCGKLIEVIMGLEAKHSGRVVSYDNEIIEN